jgi:hypothetical protein
MNSDFFHRWKALQFLTPVCFIFRPFTMSSTVTLLANSVGPNCDSVFHILKPPGQNCLQILSSPSGRFHRPYYIETFTLTNETNLIIRPQMIHFVTLKLMHFKMLGKDGTRSKTGWQGRPWRLLTS